MSGDFESGETGQFEEDVAESLRRYEDHQDRKRRRRRRPIEEPTETGEDDATTPTFRQVTKSLRIIGQWVKAHYPILLLFLGLFGGDNIVDAFRSGELTQVIERTKEETTKSNKAAMNAAASSQKLIAEGTLIKAFDHEQVEVYAPASAFHQAVRLATQKEVARQLAVIKAEEAAKAEAEAAARSSRRRRR